MKGNLEFISHLASRGLIRSDDKLKYWICLQQELVTFPLWAVTGQLVGYQQYNWKGSKSRHNISEGKYWTYRRKDINTVFGLEYIDLSSSEPLYVCEGVWDCISMLNLGKRCVAVLTNNPKPLKSWFNTLPCHTIALCEGDKAGKVLRKSCNKGIFLPEGQDPNSMNREDLLSILDISK